MRSHYWQFLINAEGQPIQDANISVYEANSTIPAGIYQSEYGGSIINTVPQFSTTPEGYFEFWVDTNDYAGDIKFKIAWDKIGISSGFIDFVDVFYTLAVDETDVDILKNKTVSNYLAYLWENHRIHNDIIDDVTNVHNIYSVDETDTNTDKNKLISNRFAKILQDHLTNPAISGAHGLEPVDEFNTNSVYNKILNNSIAKIWQDHVDTLAISGSPHGLSQVDENDINTDYNKLLSNILAKIWQDHVDTLAISGSPHGLAQVDETDTNTDYNKLLNNIIAKTWNDHVTFLSTLVDGSRPFVGTVGGITPAASGDLATKGYVDSAIPSGVEASEDSGAVVLFDMSVSSSAASGAEESASIKIDNNVIIKCYSTADGVGGIENKTLKIEDVLNIKPGPAPSSASEGDIYMDSSTHMLKCYNGTIWNDLF